MNQSEQECIKIPVKPYTVTGLARAYGIHRKTMTTWIKKIDRHVGERTGYYYTPRQVRIIIDKVDTNWGDV
jgi:transposase-like protein